MKLLNKRIIFGKRVHISNLILIVFLQLFIIPAYAQSSSCNWAYGFGNTNNDEGKKIKLDGQNNLVTFGSFNGSVDFDPTAGSKIFSSNSGGTFLQKLDRNGNFLWAKQLGSNSNLTFPLSLETDLQNNIYVAGYFTGNFDADPGSNTFILNGGGSGGVYIIKLNVNGEFIWAKSILADSQSIYGYITVDVNNNVLLTGNFRNTVDFDPGTNEYNLTSSGGYDAYIMKLNKSGNFRWAKKIGGALIDNGMGIVTDLTGNVYSSGSFQGTVSKLDSSGNYVWAKSWTNSSAQATKMIISNNYLTIAGSIVGGTTTFSDGQSVSADGQDIFIFSLNLNGSLVWAKPIGGAGYQAAYDMAVDTKGNYFLTGFFSLTTDFDPSSVFQNVTSKGSYDVFILKLTNQGDFIYVETFGGTQADNGNSIAVDGDNSVFLTGNFTDKVDFDPESAVDIVSSNGATDGFIMKFHYFPLIMNKKDVSCFGGKNGEVTVGVDGNSDMYTYKWNNGQTTQTIKNLIAGSYIVSVTDQKLCSAIDTVLITQPGLLTFSSATVPTNCSGPCTGSISVTAAGGTPPYKYLWDQNAGNQITSTATGICQGEYLAIVTDAKGCTASGNIAATVSSNVSAEVYLANLAAVDLTNVSPSFAAYYTFNLPPSINANPTNPRNFVDPGKKSRFKVECTNTKSNGQSIVSGICKVRSNSRYITITDTTSALNNIGWNNKAWSADEFEISIDPNTPPGTNAYIDFIVQESGKSFSTTCIAIPISPLIYSPTTLSTIDDDNNPDSKGNDNDICEPNEIIEFYPWLDNVSTLNAEYVRGRFENLDKLSYINVWNGVPGIGTTVYDATWWNYAFAVPQKVNAGDVNTTPEYDFVFDYKNPNIVNDFKLYMVMAGGFKLFPGTALSLVQWSLPYSFNKSSITTAINPESENKDYINVYPNPFNDFINVDLKLNSKPARIELFDVHGRKLVTKEIRSKEKISLYGFNKGVYLYKLNIDGKIQSGKLIKE